jgi:hypothetical protein
MSQFGRNWLKKALLSTGILAAITPVLVAQEDPSKLTQPVLRVSKNEAIVAPAAPHPLDPAISLAHQATSLIERDLRDYTGVLVKREKIGNTTGEHEFMFLKIRHRKVENNQTVVPFSVYLAFLKPAAV